jgi:hypothetical protein
VTHEVAPREAREALARALADEFPGFGGLPGREAVADSLAARLRAEGIELVDRDRLALLRDALQESAEAFHAVGWHDRVAFGRRGYTFAECPIERCVANRAALRAQSEEGTR